MGRPATLEQRVGMIAHDPYAWPRPSEPRTIQHTRGNAQLARPGKGEGLASEFVGGSRACMKPAAASGAEVPLSTGLRAYASTVTKPTESGRGSVGLVTLGVAKGRTASGQ